PRGRKTMAPAKRERSTQAEEAQEPEGGGMSKTEAARRALEAGKEKPKDAVEYIKKEFDVDLTPQHFSSIKTQLKKKQATTGGKGRKASTRSHAVEGYLAPPPKDVTSDEPDLFAAMEAMKPLVATLGVEKVKRIAELLG